LFNNPAIRGLDWPHLRWMLTSTEPDTYQPIGWLFFGVIYRLQGLAPFGFHLASLLVHAAAAAVFFLAADILLPPKNGGSALLAPAFAALLFGLHPINVESVAMASALPDLLAGLFFLLSLWAYLLAAALEEGPWLFASAAFFLASACCRWKGVSLPFVLVA